MNINKITFVCTGNTCRSVMAEKIFENMVRGTGLQNIIPDSAGTAAMPSYRIFGDLEEVILENGLSAEGHMAKMISRKILEESDLIIVMAESHRSQINSRFPGYEDEIYLLSEYAAGQKKDISDPIGRGKEVYRQTFKEIEEYVTGLIERLKNELEKN